MKNPTVRTSTRSVEPKSQLQVLLLDSDKKHAEALKQAIDRRLSVSVSVAASVDEVRDILGASSVRQFVGVADLMDAGAGAFDKVDVFREFNVPVIALVDQYEEELRDQLIKHQVIDYVVKSNKLEINYIPDLILRIHKNISIKVLVVDDSRVSRFVLVRELVLQKFEVLQAANAEEAMLLLNKHPDIRLALIDYQLPSIDGCMLVSQMRETYPKDQLLIIGLSTSADPRLAVKFLKVGANDFISKPFNYEILLCRISQNLDMLDAVDLARDLSNTDFLSGLHNRRYFFEHGSLLLSQLPSKQACAVMMFDIDHFKKVNDQHGHDVGDKVIKHFSSLLKRHFANDLVARIGGEEFAVISLSQTHSKNAKNIDAFRALVAQQTIDLRGLQINYTCSVGVCSAAGKYLDEMMKVADRLLYSAKESGRNKVAYSNSA